MGEKSSLDIKSKTTSCLHNQLVPLGGVKGEGNVISTESKKAKEPLRCRVR